MHHVHHGYMHYGYMHHGYMHHGYMHQGYMHHGYMHHGYMHLGYMHLGYMHLGYMHHRYMHHGYNFADQIYLVNIGYLTPRDDEEKGMIDKFNNIVFRDFRKKNFLYLLTSSTLRFLNETGAFAAQ